LVLEEMGQVRGPRLVGVSFWMVTVGRVKVVLTSAMEEPFDQAWRPYEPVRTCGMVKDPVASAWVV
jgi:heme/copper-type cytochrome/quinol oxidase subunit 1